MSLIWRPELFGSGTALVRSQQSWLWFERLGPPREASRLEDVAELLDWMEEGHAVGWVSYEAAAAFDSALYAHPVDGPFAVVARAAEPIRFHELAAPAPGVRGPRWSQAIKAEQHAAAVSSILGDIAAGRVYQVNFTFQMLAEATLDFRHIAELFCVLCEADPPPYAALMALGSHVVLSLSPELFFSRRDDKIVTQPMKGTRPPQRANELATTPKDRAENLMIVDMIRNDLGRIATPGSVRVSSLFDVVTYPTVAQMTSTIQAEIPGQSLSSVFGALFPCASVVGAPKIEATRVIAELEPSPRGVYCGAIGYTLPGGEAQFSVGIRTAAIEGSSWRYGVGSGIVIESDPEMEWAECGWKARALGANTHDFELLETMLWTPDEGVADLEEHLERMAATALAFGFPYERPLGLTESIRGDRPLRLRLRCARSGEFTLTQEPLIPWSQTISGMLCPHPVDSQSHWLRFKTTHRAAYERARAACPGADEVLLWNERYELCEWITGNLVVQIGHGLYTPPLEAGCLPGIARQRALAEDKITERTLLVADLRRVTALWHINSVRGWTRVDWMETTSLVLS